MIYFPNLNTRAQHNLAMEEYLLTGKGLTEEILFFFIDEPSIIVGRNQNPLEEINRDFVREHGIAVVRRLSGGGAVYHDLGNLCFSFILPGFDRPAPDFRTFTAPIVKALRFLGANAELSGRNDILVEGFKVSGNAFYRNRHGSVCHGTLLFDTDLSVLAKALNPKPEKLAAKGVQSVRSRVANLKPFLPDIPDVEALREEIIRIIRRDNSEFHIQSFNNEDKHKIERIAAERYERDSWNYGESPMFNRRQAARFEFGEIDARMLVSDGVIRAIRLFGDYFSQGDPALIESELVGCPLEREALTAALRSVALESIFPDFSSEGFAAFLCGSSV